MANQVTVGCTGLPHGIGWHHYFKRIPYLELSALHTGPVRPSLLTKWRAAAKHPGAFGVVAPAMITHTPGPRGYGDRGWPVPAGKNHEAGSFRATQLVADATDRLVECATALSASAVIFRSPPDFSPSQSNRDAMRRFFTDVAPAERFPSAVRVWHPSGLWDPPVANAFAQDVGVLCALDPLGADPEKAFAPFWASLSGDDAYYVISGIGRSRRRTNNELLDELAEQALRHKRAWVVFGTNEPYPDALRFSSIVSGRPIDEALPESSDEFDDEEDSDDDE